MAINRLQKFSEDGTVLEGVFNSAIFSNECDNELSIYLEDGSLIPYAEKCVEHFNSLSNDMVNTICENIVKCCNLFGGEVEDYVLPQLDTPLDVLNHCWFVTMLVEVPQGEEVAYVINGEGDWGEIITFVIRGDRLLYLGRDDISPWEDDHYYAILDDNCLYLED